MKHPHYWIDQNYPHDLYPINGLWLYECSVCEKRKYFRSQPLNPQVPTDWEIYEMSDKSLTLSPPMLMINSEFAEGDRYKRYLELIK